MTDRPTHPDEDQQPAPMNRGAGGDELPPVEAMSPGVRIRAAADGEIASAHVSASEADALAFERHLRAAVGRVMALDEASDETGGAPAALHARVREAIADDRRDDSAVEASEDRAEEALTERIERLAPSTRSRSFWARPMVAVGAGLAAALAAMVGLVLVNSGPATGPMGAQLSESDQYTVRLARFVADEHTRVTSSESAAREKLFVRSQDDAVERMLERLGAPGAMGDIGMAPDALRFRGLGDCNVPGDGPSCHTQFTLVGDSGRQTVVSLFLKRTDGQLDLDPGTTYEVDTSVCGVTGTRIIVWSDGELLHVLVAEDPDGTVCDSVLRDMGLPAPTAPLL